VTTAETNSLAPMSIIAAGAVTSVGMSLAATEAAIRAGLDNFQETAFVNLNDPVIGAPIQYTQHPGLPDPEMRGHERLASFLRLAIEECLVNAGIALPCKYSIPILLVLGEAERYGRTDELVISCQHAYGSLLSGSDKTPFYRAEIGCVGTIDALQTANKLISKETPLVLLAGVDSWLNVPDMHFALSRGRLLSHQNATGFIPSEGAAAVLLGNTEFLTQQNINFIEQNISLHIKGLGRAKEESDLSGDQACYGKGLAHAIRGALQQANCDLSEMLTQFTDLTSEPYFFEEAAYARARLLRTSMPATFQRIHPAGSTGNLGAAFGPLILGLAWQTTQISKTSSPMLISLSSAGATRGAIVATAA
jgi:3-oxoacyl-[acyl-carrier-protein] synthase I